MSSGKTYVRDIPFFIDAASSVTYDASGLEVVNIEEARVLGMSSNTTANEVWFRFNWKDLQENICQLPTARQDMTGYFPILGPGGFGLKGTYMHDGLVLRTWKKGDGRMPVHLTLDFRSSAGAALSHTGVLYMRFIVRTAQ